VTYFFDEPLWGTISTTTVLKHWDLGGYSEMNFHMVFNGPAGAKAYPTLYFNNTQGYAEEVILNAGGYANIARTIKIFGPDVNFVIYNPTAPITLKLHVYAACCGSEPIFPRMFEFLKSPKRRMLPLAKLESLPPFQMPGP
jgi:hypothetical protein